MKNKDLAAAGLLATAVTAVTVFPAFAEELTDDTDRLSYTIGMDIGQSLADQNMELDVDLLLQAIRDTYEGNDTLLTLEEAQTERDAFLQRRQQEMEAEQEAEATRNLEEGQAFLAENSNREEVTETESGLQYRVIEEGEGPTPAGPESQVTVHYQGTLINGVEFDSSYGRGEPATFALNQVIPGWTEGLQLMNKGAKYEFFIPSELAYGDSGRPGPIGPNSTLIFEVELLDFED